MGRKRTRRQVIVPLPPRGLRPRLVPQQVRDLAMAHVVNLDDISRGRASEEVLWQTLGGVLTWLRVAEALGRGVDEMQAQHTLMTAVLARYAATGRILFTGPEYQLAKTGVMVMDLLAEQVDRPTAVAAADWAEVRIHVLERQFARQQAANVASPNSPMEPAARSFLRGH